MNCGLTPLPVPLLVPHFFRALSIPAARASSTWLCLHVYLPSARDFEQADSTCSNVALLPPNLHDGSSLNFHVQRLVGVGSTSYTELIAKRILLVSIFHRSCHDTFLARIDSHLSQLPCFFWTTALVMRASSSPCLTSFWTSSLRSWLDAELNRLLVMQPSPNRPCVTVPIISLCLSLYSALFTASSTCHFLPERSFIPSPRTCSSVLSRSIKACLTFSTLYSSTSDVSGSWNFDPVLYKPTLLRLLGTFNHLLRYLLMVRSSDSTVLLGTS